MISSYSVFSALIFYNISLAAVFLLRRKTWFLAKYSVSVLLFISALGLIRLFTPIDLEAAFIIRSRHLLPAIQHVGGFELPLVGIKICTLLLIMWGCGTAVFAARDLASALRAWRIRKEYTYIEDERIKKLAAGLGSKYVVKISPDVIEPYVVGIFRPVIYMPCIELEDEDILLILRHEAQHIRSMDGLKKLLFLLIKWLFWWNPLAHISMGQIDAILELQCDARVVHDLDQKKTQSYAETIYAVLKQFSAKKEPSDLCKVCFTGGGFNVMQRCDLITRKKPRRVKSARILCGTAVVIFILSYFVIWQPASLSPEIEGEIELTRENAYIIHEDGEYRVYYNGSFFDIISESELAVPPFCNLEIKEGD